MHFQAFSFDFMKKYWIFKVHYFSSSDVGFNAFSSAYKISLKNIEFLKFKIFPVRMLGSMHFQAFSYNFTNKYWIFKVHYFSSSDVGFKSISRTNIEFSKFNLFLFRFKIQCIFKRFYQISWINIVFSKFTIFLV